LAEHETIPTTIQVIKNKPIPDAPARSGLTPDQGITEAINPEEEEFGLEKLESVLLENLEGGPGELVQIVNQTVSEFTQSEIQFDDMTIVVAKKIK
jgi:precorrin-6B methylase 1